MRIIVLAWTRIQGRHQRQQEQGLHAHRHLRDRGAAPYADEEGRVADVDRRAPSRTERRQPLFQTYKAPNSPAPQIAPAGHLDGNAQSSDVRIDSPKHGDPMPQRPTSYYGVHMTGQRALTMQACNSYIFAWHFIALGLPAGAAG